MKTSVENNTITFYFEGRITAENAGRIESEALSALSENSDCKLRIDASALEYISSAGLRIIMRLHERAGGSTEVANASSDVYDIFEMTGFTEMFTVTRKMKEISVDGLPYIGAGANGKIYRLDSERIVKVYNPISNPPEKIMREKDSAREAFVHNIPCEITFEAVRVGSSIGLIYEMIDAETLGAVIRSSPDKIPEYAVRMAEMLKKLHSTEFKDDILPDARVAWYGWIDIAERSGFYARETIEKLRTLVGNIPSGNTFIHGDFHPGNIMVRNGEWLLIDMGDASVGHPLIDLTGAYQIMKLIPIRKRGKEMYTGMTCDDSIRMWDLFIRAYFGTDDEGYINRAEELFIYYAAVRSLSGIIISELIPAQEKERSAHMAEQAFLKKYEQLGSKPSLDIFSRTAD